MSASAQEAVLGIDRFVLKERIGGGAMGEVFRAHDRERNEDVALKMLRDPEPQRVYLFKREFRALADVAHPNLVRLHELVSAGDRWFFTMELIDGVDFLSWVRRDVEAAAEEDATPTGFVEPGSAPGLDGEPNTVTQAPPTQTAPARRRPTSRPPVPVVRVASPLRSAEQWERLREGTRQLAIGVQALHDRGSLHRDIKPSNVMVTAEGRVVLLDFGIITELSRPSAADAPGQFFGTPAYMAPEVGTRRGLDAPADWYAVGVMLYEAMAGRRPFHAPGAELLELKRQRDPIPVSELAIAPPADLESLCTELLQRAPERRPSGPEILERLGARWSPTTAPARSERPDAPLVGRDDQLAALRAAYGGVIAGEPRVVLISGPSGAGKSALVAHFLDEVAAEGQAMLVPGRCYERESVPFKAVDDLIDNLCEQLAARRAPELAGLLPRRVTSLARLFPALDRIEAVRSAPRRIAEPTDPHERRRLAFAALRELLTRVSAQQPVVLYIDDGQWGDDDSAALLAEVFRAPYAPPVLLIVTYRETADMGRFVEHVRDIDRGHVALQVGDLAPDDARALADQILGEAGAPPHLADVIARDSGGNALFVTELARTVIAGADAQHLASLDDLVRARVVELPPAARRLLQLLATAAWPVPRAIATRAAEVEAAPSATRPGVDIATEAIAALLAARLIHVRAGRDGDLLETFHDWIRLAVFSPLTAGELRDLHRHLADAIPEGDARLVEHLAMHLDSAGEAARAGACYRRAADAAAAKLAFGRAARMYARAIELLSPAGPERADLYARMADAFQNAGNGVESAAAYRAAADDVDRSRALRYRGMAGQQLLRAGHIDEGLAAIEDVLAEVGLRMPRSRAGALMSLLYHRLLVRLRGLHHAERSADAVSLEQLTKIDVCWTASVAVGLSDTIAGAVFQSRHLLEALRAGEPAHVSRALAIEGVYRSISSSSRSDAVDEVAVRARDLADRTGDPITIAWANGSYALTRYQRGQWRRATQTAQISLAAIEGVAGMWFERATVELYRLWALHWLGHFRELTERATSLRAQAIDLGDRYAATDLSIGLPAIQWLVRDQPDEGRQAADEVMASWPQQRYHLQHHWHAYAIAHVDLYQGRARAALDRLRRAWKDAGKALIRNVQMVRVELLFAQGRAALMTAGDGAPDRAALLREASRCVRGLRRERRNDAAGLAACLDAAVRVARGDLDAAIPLLTTAMDRFSELEMSFLAEAARRARGLLLGERGTAAVRDAEAWMTDQTIVDPAALCRVFMPGFPEPGPAAPSLPAPASPALAP